MIQTWAHVTAVQRTVVGLFHFEATQILGPMWPQLVGQLMAGLFYFTTFLHATPVAHVDYN